MIASQAVLVTVVLTVIMSFCIINLSVYCCLAPILLCMLFFTVHGPQGLNIVTGGVQKLQKVQINKLSSSLSRERAEAAELSEVAEMTGMTSPRNRAFSPQSRAGSRPDSPGRAFRGPCRPPSRPTSARYTHHTPALSNRPSLRLHLHPSPSYSVQGHLLPAPIIPNTFVCRVQTVSKCESSQVCTSSLYICI